MKWINVQLKRLIDQIRLVVNPLGKNKGSQNIYETDDYGNPVD